jgi:hypothetical protein
MTTRGLGLGLTMRNRLPLAIIGGCVVIMASQHLRARTGAALARSVEATSGADELGILLSRVGAPGALAISQFKKAGMQDVTPHSLTADQRRKVAVALAALPKLTRHVLALRLHTLAFLDGIPGEGTGLTSPASVPGLYDISLRTSVIDESLIQFLTTKEALVFLNDGTGASVTVTGTGADAVTYVLLHESAHILDKVCNITGSSDESFESNVWRNDRELAPALAGVTPKTHFRGGGRLPLTQAPAVYDALARTPFVSLYATANRKEDFAELLAWQNVAARPQGDLVITEENAGAGTSRRWHPLESSGVRVRFARLSNLLGSPMTCRGLF